MISATSTDSLSSTAFTRRSTRLKKINIAGMIYGALIPVVFLAANFVMSSSAAAVALVATLTTGINGYALFTARATSKPDGHQRPPVFFWYEAGVRWHDRDNESGAYVSWRRR